FFSSRRRHTRSKRDWSSDVCSSDLRGVSKKVAQLIKLRDYISRYELDIYRYPSQYIRLKRDRWEKLLLSWESDFNHDKESKPEPKKKKSLFSKLSPFRKKVKKEETELTRSEEHTSELQSRFDLVCRLLLEKKKI